MSDITGIAVSPAPKDTVQQYLPAAQQAAPELAITANAIKQPEANAKANAEEQEQSENNALSGQEKQELNEEFEF